MGSPTTSMSSRTVRPPSRSTTPAPPRKGRSRKAGSSPSSSLPRYFTAAADAAAEVGLETAPVPGLPARERAEHVASLPPPVPSRPCWRPRPASSPAAGLVRPPLAPPTAPVERARARSAPPSTPLERAESAGALSPGGSKWPLRRLPASARVPLAAATARRRRLSKVRAVVKTGRLRWALPFGNEAAAGGGQAVA